MREANTKLINMNQVVTSGSLELSKGTGSGGKGREWVWIGWSGRSL